jgi:RHS repeat-associated protein
MMTGSSIGSVSDGVTYNGFGELRQYQAKYSGSTVYSVDYGTRDKLGRVVTKTETVNGETHTYSYVYDPNTDELTDVYKDGALVSHYDYDSNGNRVRYTGANGTFNGTYDDQDRMLSYGGNNYQYTANGELKSKTNVEGTTVYDYDVLGNLRAVTLADGTRIEYINDGAYRRLGKKVNGKLVQGFLYQDALKPVAELDESGNLVSRFVYGTNLDVPDYIIKNGSIYKIISDHLGSPRLVINIESGLIVQKIDYNEYGKVILDTNPGFQPFGYAGGIYDPQTSLIKFGVRDYDTELGRWTCKDPVGFYSGTTNQYAYVSNDPINWADAFGTERKPGKTPPKLWPNLPKNIGGKNPKWNPNGYWEGKNGNGYSWDDRAHGTGVDRGQGAQGGHWDEEKNGRPTGRRYDKNGNPLPCEVNPDEQPYSPLIPAPNLTPQQVQQVTNTSTIIIVGGTIIYIIIKYGWVLAFI